MWFCLLFSSYETHLEQSLFPRLIIYRRVGQHDLSVMNSTSQLPCIGTCNYFPTPEKKKKIPRFVGCCRDESNLKKKERKKEGMKKKTD